MRLLHVITRINQGGTARWLDVLVDKEKRRDSEVFIRSSELKRAEEEGDLVAYPPIIKVSTMGQRISPTPTFDLFSH